MYVTRYLHIAKYISNHTNIPTYLKTYMPTAITIATNHDISNSTQDNNTLID